MFRRKLLALEYQRPDDFNIDDETEFRNMVVWLEDQKIRHYKIEDRVALRNVADTKVWENGVAQYLKDVNSPYSFGSSQEEKLAVVDWLLGYAVRLEHGDNLDKYKQVTPESVQAKARKPAGSSNNPLDRLDFNDPDFKAGVTSLSMLLKVPPHSDHLVQLKAISLLIQDRMASIKNNQNPPKKDEAIPLAQTVLGFETKDYIINEAAKIIRLLHIKELRDLQNNINSAIVSVQAITADPKTDQKLGKVGRG
ncbi:hypothetical protein LOTGIDRAFT_112115 [Lottia gigantea]|uniref:RNA transcription, translation and transport factor protein n=1 Tax=Lottia gigantea TaxID=225164 RepID=V4B2H8_LOTGI|nr:hypothetical protein LOTGIDRAFT_112115 [Lottia gigantea]ESP00602.1 hypothetical protein LOTGIDRAFT_112115 [Lottia gigantea]